MKRLVAPWTAALLSACGSGLTPGDLVGDASSNGVDSRVSDASDAQDVGAGDPCSRAPCYPGVSCRSDPSRPEGFACGPCPPGQTGDGMNCRDFDECESSPCFGGVKCHGLAAPETGFRCDPCPPGYEGDGITCSDFDACASRPCLAGTTCTDSAPPDTRHRCSRCTGADCPVLRALAGPDHTTIAGVTARLRGAAANSNGGYACAWTNNRTQDVLTTCEVPVSPTADAVYTLTVTDASGATAADSAVVRRVQFLADAGPAQNLRLGETATLTAHWAGASCATSACIACRWTRADGTGVAETCSATVAPSVTTQYVLTVTDGGAARSAMDSTTAYVTDAEANLCGWNVVVLTSDEYPTSTDPNYACSSDGSSRRQITNGKPSLVLSDLVVENAQIIGFVGVETRDDDDIIGFAWGFDDPAHFYLLNWKQSTQALVASPACGNALEGIAVKKIDAPAGSPTAISHNSALGYGATDFVYGCALSWSTDRDDLNLLGDDAIYLHSPRDPGSVELGWRDGVTYRFEFYHGADRTKILVYEDELRNGTTANVFAQLDVIDSTYPRGRFAFFTNSQADVDFGHFLMASLDGFAANAGPDRAARLGDVVTLTANATLAVPPLRCVWTEESGSVVARTCTATVAPTENTTYALEVTDDFGRATADRAVVSVAP